MINLKKTMAALAGLALLATTGAIAQDKEKETPPPGSTPKDFTLPTENNFALENGLRATMVEFGATPKTAIVVIVRSGNLNEGGQTWLASLSGDFLLEGTANYNAAEIATAAATMGGSINVNVDEDQTVIGADVLSEFAPQMVALLADVVRNPAFPESELERLKRNRLRQLSVAETQPQQMAAAAFRKAMYADHPYGQMFPTKDQLSTYTIKDAREFYNNNFGAKRTHVFVAGMHDTDATRKAIESSFRNWDPGPEVLKNPPAPVKGKVALGVVDRPGASQSNLYLGLPTIGPNEEDWIRLQLSNTLLGGYFSSRITANIREDKGYTYSPRSLLSTRYHDAYWAQVAAVTTEVTGPAMQEIMYEIENLQQNPPPAEELDGVKNYAAGVFVLQNSTRQGIVNVLNYLDLQGLPKSYLTDYVTNVMAVTPEQISETTSKYLRKEDMTLVVVGDSSQVAEQVAPWTGAENE